MLESAEKFEKAFDRLDDIDRDYESYFSGTAEEFKGKDDRNNNDTKGKDSRYKMKYVKYWLHEMYPDNMANDLIRKVENAMENLYKHYLANYGKVNSTDGDATQISVNGTDSSMDVDDEDYSTFVKSQFKRHLMKEDCVENKSEIAKYLAEACDNGDDKSFDILAWWKVNASRYPVLSLIAKDVLAMSVSTVPSESAFSTGGRILDPFRSSLSPKTVEALVCGQNWLRSSGINLPRRGHSLLCNLFGLCFSREDGISPPVPDTLARLQSPEP
ncbi:Zinc finger BED domain-containing protein RICESLEEPER 2 [Rhynchospora pubera]|uniref:Zinc finger BED domain-containing protein RICESLEEPER 2 n=1 Tax=Rhynchospora pubera TaxID=906938 RepID=A0AAV8CDS0_9POAL|nr:Zinc finger BED domain-containing protein RICESLEEPER 2 [Rhynchospora pubera]